MTFTIEFRPSAGKSGHAGVRPGVMGAYQGEAGLTLGDLPGLKISPKPTFGESPFTIRVPAKLSKTRRAYTTFGTSQLQTSLLAYLEERQANGEELSPSSAVVAPHETRGAAQVSQEGARFSRGFVTTTAVVKEIGEVLRSTVPDGTRWRPYVLRSYCATRLLMAEGSGKVTRNLREAILGHKTGISGQYNVGKTWSSELLKEARAQYKRSEPFLLTGNVPVTDSADLQRQAAVLLLLAGKRARDEDEARRMVEGKSGSNLADLIQSAVAPPVPERRRPRAVAAE